MNMRNAGRARRVAVAETVIGDARFDYADAFEVDLRDDWRSAEQVFRAGLELAPLPMRWVIVMAHRHLLRLRLGPLSSPGYILGWRILAAEPEVVHLEAAGPLLRGVLVARRFEPGRAVLTTFVIYGRPRAARAIWAIAGPIHRRVAPYLMERAAAITSAASAAAARDGARRDG
jgi:hypothetical protein